jgi:hypothetical protein
MLPFGTPGGQQAQALSATPGYPENVNDPGLHAFMRRISRGSACP